MTFCGTVAKLKNPKMLLPAPSNSDFSNPQFLGPPRASLILACVEEYSWGLCLDRNNICGNSARAVKVLFQALQALTCLNVQSSKRKLNSLDLFLATILPFAM